MPVITELPDMADALSIKDKGNDHLKKKEYIEALTAYTSALSLSSGTPQLTATLYNNRAQANLYLKKYPQVVEDATKALELLPHSERKAKNKALYRRAQAYEQQGQVIKALQDIAEWQKYDQTNKDMMEMYARIQPLAKKEVAETNSTQSQMKTFFESAFNQEEPEINKRKAAFERLVDLTSEESNCQMLCQANVVLQIVQLLETEKQRDIRYKAIGLMENLIKGSKDRAKLIYDTWSLRSICVQMGQEDEAISNVSRSILRKILLALTDLEKIKKERDAHEEKRRLDPHLKLRPFIYISEKIDEYGQKVASEIFEALIKMLNFHKVSAYGRDNAISIIIGCVTRKNGVGWSVKFIDKQGVWNLLEVAGTIPEQHGTLKVTVHSLKYTATALQTVWEDLMSEKEQDIFKEAVNEFFNDLFGDEILESKLQAVMALSALLQGVYEVGSMVLGRPGVLEMILAMADSNDAIHTKYAVEALVNASSRKERCSGVINQATPILKKLYKSQNDTIKVRALVGLCKLGSFGGADASAKTFGDGANAQLSKACRKFLCNPEKNVDLRKWAAEGLSFLTLDADIKEELVTDKESLIALIELAKNKDCAYSIATTFVNCTNSYDQKKPDPELVQIAKFAKQHVPEEHEKDKEPFVGERVKKMVEAGIVNALVPLCDTDRDVVKELLARVYLSIATKQEHRGFVIQQGGAKTLIPLANKGTDRGKIIAAHALAKIAITNDPAIAFPGQRSCEVIRPLLSLLKPDRTALETFESLMALTNLAGMNDTVRKKIMTEGGISQIEMYQYDDDDRLQKAATQVMCNMVQLEEVAETFKGENDRLKLMVLFCQEEDEELQIAASGAVAFMSHDRAIANKITQVTTQWYDILLNLCQHENVGLQHRGVFIVCNMIHTDKDLARKFIEGQMFELLTAITLMDDPMRLQAKNRAFDALEKAAEYGFVKKPVKKDQKA